jgi:hypothetical protein
VQLLQFADRVFLQFGVEREHHRPHRRGGGDFVGAHRRFGEMLQRYRLVVPLGVVAHRGRDIDRRVHPFRRGASLVGFDDGAAHDVDGHAVAPGIVHGHGGVLQADDAVADHGQRLAFDLGVAVAHGHRDFLVRAGENLRLDVAAVVDDGFVQTAEARGAVHRQVLDVQRLEHVDHEVAAARGLGHRVALRWQRFHRDLDRAGGRGFQGGNGRLERRIDLGIGDRRRQRRGACKGGALEKLAATGIRQRAALRHVFASQKGAFRAPFDRLKDPCVPAVLGQGTTFWPSARTSKVTECAKPKWPRGKRGQRRNKTNAKGRRGGTPFIFLCRN